MKHVFLDSLTGDPLSFQEWLSWKLQAIIRSPWFLLGFTVGTIVCWATNDQTILLWWNAAASALAIYVEQIIGTGFGGQARRDAVVLRKLRQEVHEEMQELRLVAQEIRDLATALHVSLTTEEPDATA